MTLHIKQLCSASLVAFAATLAAGGARADTFVQTYENPGVQNSTVSFTGGVSIENFDSLPIGSNQGFATQFGPGATELSYRGVQIKGADEFGGAGGAGNYAVSFSNSGYSVTLSRPVTYFGYWLSALDSGNEVDFYRGASEVGTLTAEAVLTAIGSNTAYFGNPNTAFLGQDSTEPYAFVNFFDTTGSFDKVVFRQDPRAGGYESDNHTIGNFTDISGNPVTAVPEPSTYVLMLVGLAGLARFGRVRRAAR